ncbi:FAD-linked oxidase C-terminal domain-containing protein [Variovorax sp. J22R24]|uniref:FAD-binding oxidoreductase n=1 Tax=Variovorax gracilis TaxID=3053502 RepID=UPI002576BCD4|nr:FAD-linked oxidase C-terminal domain-containing protein [Variovorax sp. J22R24]MDM0110033.1 FAD-linked oxidase C-terminal domain-containing protein [Variovorax sp. J22R24]
MDAHVIDPARPSAVDADRRAPSAELIATLRRRFGSRLSTADSVLLQHGSDESSYRPLPPDVVVYVHGTDEAAFVVRACARERVPVIAFGVGSSIEGHLLAVEGGVCIDFSQMNQVLAIRTSDLTATVQAGVTRSQLNAALSGTGFFFSVDPGADATVGGMVATAASGTNTVRYGTMRDNLLSLTVVTADGEVIRTASHARKSSAGYNLTQLFCGSEGTLGLITEATVRIHPHPEVVAAAVVHFPTVRAAVDGVIESIQLGVPLARAEMLDALTIKAVNAHSRTTLAEKPTLFLEFAGSQAQIDEQAAVVREIAAGHGGGEFQWASLQEERSRLWTPRHHAYFASLQLKPGNRSITTDACVPLSALATCVEETLADIEAHGLLAPVFGHVGDGNFHCLVLVDPDSPKEVEAAEAFSHRLVQRSLRHGGTSTGEHGVGLHKMQYLVEEHGPHAVALMRSIKRALDPHNIFNPGKVVSFA